MKSRPVAGFEVIETPGGWTYVLDPGRRERTEELAFELFIIGSPLLLSGVFFLGVFVRSVGWSKSLVPALLFSLLVPTGGTWLLIGVGQRLFGRDEFRLDMRTVRVIRRLGPFRWSRLVRRSRAAQFTVTRKLGHDARGNDKCLTWFTLVVEDENGLRRPLVGNYPREMLLTLAADISGRWRGLSTDTGPDGIGSKALAVREESPTDIRDRTVAPPGTRFRLDRLEGDGVKITLPPDGMLSLGCSGIGVLSFGLAIALALPPLLGKEGGSGTAVILLGPIGVLAFIGAVHNAVSQRILVVTADSLLQETRGVRGASWKVWKKADIRSIRAETRIVEEEDSTIYMTRVLIRTNGAMPEELQVERTKPELEWIATTLRGVLGVPDFDAPTDDHI